MTDTERMQAYAAATIDDFSALLDVPHPDYEDDE